MSLAEGTKGDENIFCAAVLLRFRIPGPTPSPGDAPSLFFALSPRLASQPHDNVLGALAVDDSSPLMPMMMPKATDDLETRMNNDSFTIGDKLRQALTVFSV